MRTPSVELRWRENICLDSPFLQTPCDIHYADADAMTQDESLQRRDSGRRVHPLTQAAREHLTRRQPVSDPWFRCHENHNGGCFVYREPPPGYSILSDVVAEDLDGRDAAWLAEQLNGLVMDGNYSEAALHELVKAVQV